jgi:hypothetical protein
VLLTYTKFPVNWGHGLPGNDPDDDYDGLMTTSRKKDSSPIGQEHYWNSSFLALVVYESLTYSSGLSPRRPEIAPVIPQLQFGVSAEGIELSAAKVIGDPVLPLDRPRLVATDSWSAREKNALDPVCENASSARACARPPG